MKTAADQTSSHLNLDQPIELSTAVPDTRSALPSRIDRLDRIDRIENARYGLHNGSPTDRIDRIKTGYRSDKSCPKNETNNLQINHMYATDAGKEGEKFPIGERPAEPHPPTPPHRQTQ
jgi:hypothetical protein